MADGHPLDNSDLSAIEMMLRDLDVQDLEITTPPDDVWAGIERSLAAERSAEADRDVDDHAEVISLSDRRHRFVTRALGIAAAVVLAVGGVAVFSGRGATQSDVLATATLSFDAAQFDPLGADASASVSLINVDDRLEIALDEANLPADLAEPADLEIWLIEPDPNGGVADLVSLGVVHSTDRETFVVPAGYDPAVYRVVDISVEPHDGNHDHSGRSILRGPLTDV
jgi:anti-sigma-K factor RskA